MQGDHESLGRIFYALAWVQKGWSPCKAACPGRGYSIKRGVEMPEIGEIRKADEVGYKCGGELVWHACVGCGKERWTRLLRDKPESERCTSCACHSRGLFGEKNPKWKGGRVNLRGYIEINLHPDDFFYPMCNKKGYVYEHRLVMAKHLGRSLHSWEVVHHRNGIRDDNRIENLHLATDAGHKQISHMERVLNRQASDIKQLKDDNQKLKVEMGKLKKELARSPTTESK
ncbi:MAG: hypothetical protein DDT33_01631 [Firmicutes bacterium]|nr:hypothetical protein [Bacillota bacterium]